MEQNSRANENTFLVMFKVTVANNVQTICNTPSGLYGYYLL